MLQRAAPAALHTMAWLSRRITATCRLKPAHVDQHESNFPHRVGNAFKYIEFIQCPADICLQPKYNACLLLLSYVPWLVVACPSHAMMMSWLGQGVSAACMKAVSEVFCEIDAACYSWWVLAWQYSMSKMVELLLLTPAALQLNCTTHWYIGALGTVGTGHFELSTMVSLRCISPITSAHHMVVIGTCWDATCMLVPHVQRAVHALRVMFSVSEHAACMQ
jgi:hypothetical protein